MLASRPRSASLCILLLSLLIPGSVAVANDWSQWRGASQTGTVQATSLADAEALGFEFVWRRPLGSGYSSISVVEDTGVTLATMGDKDWVVAFDVDSGEEHWRVPLGDAYLGRSGADDGPMSTPAIAGRHVYALSGDGRFVAVELSSGDVAWEYRLGEVFSSEPDFYGYSTAPVVHGDRVYLLAGGGEAPMLVAFDRTDGEVIWKAGSEIVQHQNLVVAELAGIEQVVAPGRASVSGFATDDGRLLWSHEFEGNTEAGGVVVAGGDRVLVTRWNSAHLLQVSRDSAEQLWETRRLGSSYAVPVLRDGYFYGFSRQFLSCVNAETGEMVWRSRPPGGRGLIAVDDHLLLLGDDGHLVAVEATPDGYRETGRQEIFPRRRVYTPPTYAANRILVRDLNEMVALSVKAVGAPLERMASSGTGSFEADADEGLLSLLARMESGSASEIRAAVDTLQAEYSVSPVLEGGMAHFLYKGDEPDLAIVGDMTGAHAEVPMRRLGNTDWHHQSFPAPESGRWEYRFKVFEAGRLDPRNESVIVTPGGARSVVSFGESDGSEDPPFCSGCARGRVAAHQIVSQVPERSYNLSVYTPPGYEEADGPLPMVVWAQGEGAQEYGDVVAWLDGLIGLGEVEPVLGVFFELPEAAWWEQSRERLDEIMAQDVMPFLEANYRLPDEGLDRAVVLHGWSAPNMLIWGLENGVGTFVVQSPFFGEYHLGRDVIPRLRDVAPLRLYADWGTFDQVNPDWAMNVATQSRQLADAFGGAGAQVTAIETPGGANWTRWSSQTGNMLRTLFSEP